MLYLAELANAVDKRQISVERTIYAQRTNMHGRSQYEKNMFKAQAELAGM